MTAQVWCDGGRSGENPWPGLPPGNVAFVFPTLCLIHYVLIQNSLCSHTNGVPRALGAALVAKGACSVANGFARLPWGKNERGAFGQACGWRPIFFARRSGAAFAQVLPPPSWNQAGNLSTSLRGVPASCVKQQILMKKTEHPVNLSTSTGTRMQEVPWQTVAFRISALGFLRPGGVRLEYRRALVQKVRNFLGLLGAGRGNCLAQNAGVP